MRPYECFELFTALKAHFNTNTYDFFKYGGKIRVGSEAAFQAKSDRYFYEKIAKKYKNRDELVRFFLANILEKPKVWIGDCSPEVHQEYEQVHQNLEYLFGSDIAKIILFLETNGHNFNSLFDCQSGQHPILLTMLKSRVIRLETFIIMDAIFNFIPMFDRMIIDPVIWTALSTKCRRYRPFLKIDAKHFRKVMKGKLISAGLLA